MVTEMSTDSEAGTACSTRWAKAVPRGSPSTKASEKSLPQSHWPLFFSRQTLSNVSPGRYTVSSGTVTSVT